MNKLNSKNQQKIDSIAEQWVNIVLAHLRTKKLNEKKKVNRVTNRK